MTSKARRQRAHANARIRERFGDAITQDRLIGAIRSGGAKLVRRESLAVRHYDIEMDGVSIRAIYNKRLGVLVTAYHRGGARL